MREGTGFFSKRKLGNRDPDEDPFEFLCLIRYDIFSSVFSCPLRVPLKVEVGLGTFHPP